MQWINNRKGYSLVELSIVIFVSGVLIYTALASYKVYHKTVAQTTTSTNVDYVTAAVGNYLIQAGAYPCPAAAVDRSNAAYGIEGDCSNQSQAVGTCAGGICIEESERLVGSSGSVTVQKIGLGSGLSSPYYAANNWTCGPNPCNLAGYYEYRYTGKPSIACPNPTDHLYWWGYTSSHDVCTVQGMVDYYTDLAGLYSYWASYYAGLGGGWSWIATLYSNYASQVGNYFVVNNVVIAAGTPPRVRRGVIPFRTLNIPESSVVDGNNRLLEYAVTEHLAVTSTYKKDEGGVSVINGTGTTLVTPAASAHFVVVSHGDDGAGAYTAHGKQYAACPTGTKDSENCNTTSNNKAVYRVAAFAEQEGANHSDDTVSYYTAIDTPLWKVADPSALHIHDLVDAGLPAGGKVGVGTNAPTTTVAVAGNALAEQSAMAVEVCSGSDCFPSEKIAGTKPEMDCANTAGKPYMVGVSGGAVKCDSQVVFGCKTKGQIMVGISAAGKPVCQDVTTCASQPATVCAANDVTLPVGLEGQTAPRTMGDSRTRTWKCTGGNWVLTSETGVCSCTPSVTNTTLACGSVLSGGWLGTIARTTTITCGPYTVVDSDNTSGCGCTDPKTEQKTNACATGYTGLKTSERTWTCSSATAGSWSAWNQISDTCTCTASIQTQSLSCPTAYTGIWQQKRTFDCPTSTWGPWTDDIKTCACTGTSQNQTVSCGAGQVGTKTQTRTYDCVSDSWNPWVDVDTSGCSAATYKWKTKSYAENSSPVDTHNAGAKKGSTCTTYSAHAQCWGNASGGGYWNYPDCACE